MLGSSKIVPTQDNKETAEDFKKRETTQYNKQERVLTTILYRYGTTTVNDIEKEVRKIGLPNNVEGEEVYADDGTLLRRITVYKVLKLLKARYTNRGLRIFTLVISKFYQALLQGRAGRPSLVLIPNPIGSRGGVGRRTLKDLIIT